MQVHLYMRMNDMNVGELKQLLENYPDDLEILKEMYSDYHSLEEDCFYISKAVDKFYYYMKSHPTMKKENKGLEKTYLCIVGN